MTVLRTPEERFADLPGFPYSPRYADDLEGFDGLRVAYVDEGPADAENVFLCLHGQPTWSYLYRRMIPVFLQSGARVVAPDFFGFGRSDKPVDEAFYTFERHRNSLLALVERLDLRPITLVMQDWGGLLGLTLPMEDPTRYKRLILMNTGLMTGGPLNEGFLAWRAWCNANPDMAIARLMRRACPHLNEAEAAAYEAPFPSADHKAGVRRFPNIAADSRDAPGVDISRRARDFLRDQWSGASFMAIGMTDPVLGEAPMRALQRIVRHCPEPMILPEAGHFVQEWGEPVAREALRAFGDIDEQAKN